MKKDTDKYQMEGIDSSSTKDGAGNQSENTAYNPPYGLRRTLSTELVTKQAELRTMKEVSRLVKHEAWTSGQVIITKGNTDRDLFFLTKGAIEIWSEEKDGCLILNEMKSPNIFGDLAFLSGLPRTATVKAKTDVELFVLRYDTFMNVCKGAPEWLAPLLSSFVSGIKTLHYTIAELKDKYEAP